MTGAGAMAYRRFPAHPSSVGEARALVRKALGESADESLLGDAQLLVSEVVTNALVHAGTAIDLAVEVWGAGVRVEVTDGAPHLPVRRDYAAMAGTGRGLKLLDALGDRWGVRPVSEGKTVWFELGPVAAELGTAEEGGGPSSDDVLTVALRNVPLLLHSAWSQHAESVLREYLLFSLADAADAADADDGLDGIEVHAAAHEVIALLVESIPDPDLGEDPDALLAGATEPFVTRDEVLLSVPRAAVAKFAVLDETLEAALQLAQAGKFLTPPIQPEMRALRQWLCREVAAQAAGAPATPWSTPVEVAMPARPTSGDLSAIGESTDALIAADHHDRIVAASRSALRLLGYDHAEQLVGQRLLAVIPARYHQAHLAGFTLHLSVGRSPLLERSVTVPVVRRDGTETEIQLTVRARHSSAGDCLFVAELAASSSS